MVCFVWSYPQSTKTHFHDKHCFSINTVQAVTSDGSLLESDQEIAQIWWWKMRPCLASFVFVCHSQASNAWDSLCKGERLGSFWRKRVCFGFQRMHKDKRSLPTVWVAWRKKPLARCFVLESFYVLSEDEYPLQSIQCPNCCWTKFPKMVRLTFFKCHA